MNNFRDSRYLMDGGDTISPDKFSGEAKDLILELNSLEKRRHKICQILNRAAALEEESEQQIIIKAPMVSSDQVFRGIRISKRHAPQELLEFRDYRLPNIFSISYSCNCDSVEVTLASLGEMPPSEENIKYASRVISPTLLNYLLGLRAWCDIHLVDVVVFEDTTQVTNGFPLFGFNPDACSAT